MDETAKLWVKKLAPYRTPDDRRASFEVILTLTLFVAGWIGMWALVDVSVIALLLLAVPTAGLMVRLFIIQHDCGHAAMFSSSKWNDRVGRFLGVLTLTPYDFWRRSHALHHAASGNLDRRGIGDIDTLTVDEYLALDRMGRFKYRLYRHPLVMFGLGPAYLFLLQHRLPLAALREDPSAYKNVVLTNLGIAVLWVGLAMMIGVGPFFLIQGPVVMIGASIGVWLFYVQHQFDPTYWDHADQWNREHAALHGSSFYDLPKPLMWMTGNIGIHHVHHLSSRIPFHRLPQVLKDFPELKSIGRLTFWQSIKCVPLALWDEQSRKLISFRDLRGRVAA